MNIDNLKIFCRVIEEGSITNAARLSYISQPAVTKKINQLEDEYGTLLFERANGRLQLTHAGEVLYPYAKEIIEYYLNSIDAIQEITQNYDTVLQVGGSLTIGEYWLPQILGHFNKSYPHIDIRLSLGNTPQIISKLENNEIDIALVEGVVGNPHLQIEKFAEDELILITSSEHRWNQVNKIEIDELVEEKMIWREPESLSRLMVENYLRDLGVLERIKSAMELGSIQAVKSAVEVGLGVSILSKLTVVKEIEYGILSSVSISNFKLSRDLWMVQKPQRFTKSGLHHFISFIRNQQ